MNDWLAQLGLQALKPLATVLLLPPLPLLLLLLWGAWACHRGRRWGPGWVLSASAALWACCTPALGLWLNIASMPPPALDAAARARLQRAPHTAIVVLGAGRQLGVAEYAAPDLSAFGHERLRYGVWLARQTDLPVAYSGGLSYFVRPGPSEADIAQVVAKRDYGLGLRWFEGQSRDTNENAQRSVALLRGEGITRIVLVTHDFHMRRAQAAFVRAVERSAGTAIEIVPAPMGLREDAAMSWVDFIASAEGLVRVRLAVHEWLGRVAGA